MKTLSIYITLALAFISTNYKSQAINPYVGQILWVPYDFAPYGWEKCEGQSLSINQYETLYTLIGTTFGGDGINNFKLPDMRGKTPIGNGAGRGLTPRILGQQGGEEYVYLTPNQMPAHTHSRNATTEKGTTASPLETIPANTGALDKEYHTGTPNTTMTMTSIAGQNHPHNNMQPYLNLTCIIALQGTYPTRP